MYCFGTDSKLTHYLNICVWLADPHFALLNQVTFTLMAREKQEWPGTPLDLSLQATTRATDSSLLIRAVPKGFVVRNRQDDRNWFTGLHSGIKIFFHKLLVWLLSYSIHTVAEGAQSYFERKVNSRFSSFYSLTSVKPQSTAGDRGCSLPIPLPKFGCRKKSEHNLGEEAVEDFIYLFFYGSVTHVCSHSIHEWPMLLMWEPELNKLQGTYLLASTNSDRKSSKEKHNMCNVKCDRNRACWLFLKAGQMEGLMLLFLTN